MTGNTVLMIAEKPSLAESIAKILSENKYKTRRSIACNVFEYQDKFLGKPANFKVTSVMGHVFSLDFADGYNNWETTQPTELFSADTVKKEANPKTHVVKHLTVESKAIDYLVLWLDCDREGENICFEVMKVSKMNMNLKDKSSKRSRVYRARFSAITPTEIKKAMRNLVYPNENEAKAVDVRQELDLKIGCAFTRFQTKYFQGKYGNLDSSCVSFGPCQTPTLALCVKRHDDILSFVPEPYWTLSAEIELNGNRYTIHSTRGNIFAKDKATQLRNQIKSAKEAKVVSLNFEEKSLQRPHALNTVDLLKAASSGLGIGPHEAMHLAEKLYISGYISYPRTETTKYPKSFDFKEILSDMKLHHSWGSICQSLLRDGFRIPEGGQDIGDHPPITPMKTASEYELSGNLWRLYEYITLHFLGTLLPNAKYRKVSVQIDVQGEAFSFSGNEVTKPGFTEAMHWRAMSSDPLRLDDFQKGAVGTVFQVNLKEGATSPPGYLTESDLLGMMEKLGIGTDASMAVHIENICQRRYVQVTGKNRSLVPTDLGIVLVHGLQKIDSSLADPKLRSNMEKKISQIALGKAIHNEVLHDEIMLFQSKFENFMAQIAKMDELFEATFSPLASSGKPFSKCGRCRRYMHLINVRPVRLHCRTCNETYSLPNNGSIKLYKELICPIDKFELCLFSTGSKGKGYPICPFCYNHPPFDGLTAPMPCNTCPNEECAHSLIKNMIGPCLEEKCTGVLVLDATSAPRWKIGCNHCNLVSSFDDAIHDIKILDSTCEDCGAKEISLEFRKKENQENIQGCIVCDEEIDELLETKIVRISRSGRGRGRGRRGRRRGKGKQHQHQGNNVHGGGASASTSRLSTPKTKSLGNSSPVRSSGGGNSSRGGGNGHHRGRGRGRRRGRGGGDPSSGYNAKPSSFSLADFF